MVKEIKTRLKSYHSPEQIASCLKIEGEEYISHETIYQMIYKDYQELGKNKTAKQMNKVTEELFKYIAQEKIKTFTCDNGKKFSGHEELSKVLSASFYFANPYHSWERRLNEHTNGLLRQFFPKGTNFKIVKPEEVQKAVELINNRPQKCLDY